ncbi:MAG: hypothetical protein KAG97_03775 [Victivallales bacterium]|nr:hypothetical protein [Victivallales bacterium]
MAMTRTNDELFEATTAEKVGVKKINITANLADDSWRTINKIFEYLKSENAEIISGFAFGSHDATEKMFENHNASMITSLLGDTCACGAPTSLQLTAVAGTKITPMLLNGNRVGSMFIFDGHAHCVLAGIHADSPGGDRKADVSEAFNAMLAALKTVDMDFSNVVRMWNYLDNLLEWYDDFNTVRNAFFAKHSVYDTGVPAGTGIGASNRYGTAYIGELWALKPLEAESAKLAAFPVPSPLQCPALDYKSSFSRAVEIDSKNFKTLSVSGTASIEPGGETAFVNDTAKQIDKTIQVISAILESRGMTWSDTVRGIAYFADIDDLPLLFERMRTNGLPEDVPMAIAHAAICRDNLLFEIELDAMTER